MTHSFHEIAFTPEVQRLQREAGSRNNYAAMSAGDRYADRLTARESDFIGRRDSFYMASVGESGWPYVQHRGGPPGFMKVIDEKTLGFLDYSGNRQYVSKGNFLHDDRVSLFFMDYPNRRRLKLFGRVRIVDAGEAGIIDQLEDADYPAQIERGFLIAVEGFDWNCPAHITPRLTEAEVLTRVNALKLENKRLKSAAQGNAKQPKNKELGEGRLPLAITGMRQLTPNVRAFELRHANNKSLPLVSPGSHLKAPVRLSNGEISERHYSIASDVRRSDVWEIAVLRELNGTGGSSAIHENFELGMILNVDPPENHFPLHADTRPSVLIAGGIGITPLKSMASALQARAGEFHLHFAGTRRSHMPYLNSLERQLGEQLSIYSSQEGERMNLEQILENAPENALIYVCGPDRLLAGLMEVAKANCFPRDRIILERFS